MTWNAQGVRFVTYLDPSLSLPDVGDVWKSLGFGFEPEGTQRPRNPSLGPSVATGVFNSSNIHVAVLPGRIDIFASPTDAGFAQNSPERALDEAVGLGSRCIPAFHSTRVALVFDAAEQTSGSDASNAAFSRLVPFIPIPPVTRDVNFQINPVRQFDCAPDKTMFRLCRWGTAVMQLLSFQGFQGPGLGQGASIVESRHVVTLQTDLSSTPQAELLGSDSAVAMLKELCQEAKAVLAQGVGRLI